MTRRRRICMVVHGSYPVGEPRVAREAGVALARGYEVDVVAMRRPGEPARERVDGVRVFRLPLAHVRGTGVIRSLYEYLAFTTFASAVVAGLAARRRYAWIHVHSPPDFLMLAAVVPRLLGAKALLDVHDLSPDMLAMRFQDRRWSGPAERVLLAVERLATRLANVVLTVHEPYRDELANRSAPRAKIVVVMNSLDESLLEAGAEEAERDASRIVYHGTLAPHYGVRLLVEAAARLAPLIPELSLDVYGEGDETEALRSLASELGAADRVFISGTYLAHKDVLERIRSAAVGVIPNLPIRLNRFALSSKLFEYVALGIPVVCADLPTLRAHFDEDELIFFRAGDGGSLEKALAETLADPVAAAARSRSALRRYESYRWPISARRYAEVLEATEGE